jgi:taurine dioxygenase
MTIGAEVVGLDPEAELTTETRQALYQAWLDYGILLFRDVETIERHLDLSRCFGDLERHPLENMRAKENDLFMRVGGDESPPYVYDGILKSGTIPWHRDTAYTPDIAKGAMLRLLEVPQAEGETLFADTARAYDDLPPALQARLESLEFRSTLRRTPMEQPVAAALWQSVRQPTAEELAAAGGDVRATSSTVSRMPPVIHPALLVHPESGRRCIFLSPKEFDGFVGMDEKESNALFEELVHHMLQDRYVYRHRWAVDDAVVWDNRRVMHAAAGNRLGDRRRGLRTTLAGELRIGRLAGATQ